MPTHFSDATNVNDRGSWRCSCAAFAAAAILSALLWTGGSGAASASEPTLTVPSLPAPFNSWGVTLVPVGGSSGTFNLSFNSPALGRSVTNTIFLPSNYSASGAPSAVMYYLHGTVLEEADNPLVEPVSQDEYLIHMVSQGGGYLQTQVFDFPSQVSRARFVVVAPDTDPDYSICHTCLWINGQGPTIPDVTEPMQTETFMIDELQPLVQAILNVRTDRGGRGIMGFSMGGWSALLYGEDHPDLYSFVASISGVPETSTEVDPAVGAVAESLGFLRSQGYGVLPTRDPIFNEEFDPAEMAGNMDGEGQALVFTNGDGCVDLPADLTAEDCVGTPALTNPAASAVEVLISSDNAIGQQEFAAAGVPFSHFESPGVHGSNNHTMYADDIVPMANAVFASPDRTPTTFNYRSAQPSFDVWGYEVQSSSPVPAFTTLSDAAVSGRSFSATSDSDIDVSTPPTFQAGQAYTLTQQCGSATPSSSSVMASADGSLNISLAMDASSNTCTVAIL